MFLCMGGGWRAETVTDGTHIGEARQQAEGEVGLHVGGGGGGLGPARGGTSRRRHDAVAHIT